MNNQELMKSPSPRQSKHQIQPLANILEPPQLSLLSRIARNDRPLIDRIQSPNEQSSLPLLMRISTPSLTSVDEEDLPNYQPPRTCLSPWNGSPISRPKPERRLSSPSLPRSIPLIERLSETLPLSNRVTERPIWTMKPQSASKGKTCLPFKRKQSRTELFETSLNGRSPKRVQRTKTMLDLSVNVWDNQICRGMDQLEGEHTLTETLVAPKHANSIRTALYSLGNSTGNPGVFQANPYPNPSKPVPQATGTGFCWGIDFQPLPQPQRFTPWVSHGNR